MGRKESKPRKSGGGFCFCRPRNPEDAGVVSSHQPTRDGFPEWGESTMSNGAFMEELAAGSFSNPKDLDWCIRDPTELTLEGEEETEEEEEDPVEAWYRFWYSKGILSFVPQSIQQAESGGGEEWLAFQQPKEVQHVAATSTHRSPPPTKTQERPVAPSRSYRPSKKTSSSSSKKNNVSFKSIQQTQKQPVTAPRRLDKPLATPPPKTKYSKTSTPKTHAMTPSPRKTSVITPSSQKRAPTRTSQPTIKTPSQSSFQTPTKTAASPRRTENLATSQHDQPDVQLSCASCAQTASPSIRCPDCKTTFYCSIFCKGNDRYKHARLCGNEPKKLTFAPTTHCSPVSSVTSWPEQEQVEPEARSLHKYWEDRANLAVR